MPHRNAEAEVEETGKEGTQLARASKTAPLPQRGPEESCRVGGAGRGQFTDTLLIGGRRGPWESASSTLWFRRLWGLRACGQHACSSSTQWGVGTCSTAPRTGPRRRPVLFEEELKVLDFVKWLNCYYSVLLGCFPFPLYFLTSLNN